jgi:small conductance mechanosensitive channel
MIGSFFMEKTLGLGSHWALMIGSAFRVAFILLLAWIATLFSHRMISALLLYGSRSAKGGEEANRIATIGRVFRYCASALITLVAGTLILGELGISVAPIMGAAGVVGVAVGFGAQTLVKDYFNGFFLLLENQMSQGDTVEAGGKAGVVEEITLRYVRMRDYDGNVHFVPNGAITTVTNKTRGFAYAVVDIGVAYRENVDEVLELMRAVGNGMRADPLSGPKILEDVEIAGVENLAESAVVLRCRFKVAPNEQWNVRREFLRRIKAEFDAKGIEIPYPHLCLIHRGTQNPAGTLPHGHPPC